MAAQSNFARQANTFATASYMPDTTMLKTRKIRASPIATSTIAAFTRGSRKPRCDVRRRPTLRSRFESLLPASAPAFGS